MKQKKKLVIILICLIISIVGFLGTFYFYMKENDEPINRSLPDDITGSNLIFSMENSKSVEIKEMIPTLDKFGVLNEAFVFQIKNTSNAEKSYLLKLVDESSTIKNEVIRYQLMKNDVEMGIFTLSSDGILDSGAIQSNEEITYALRLWLSYDSSIKVGSLKKHISIEEKDLLLDQSKANFPVLLDNMLPVYYSEEDNAFHKADISNNYYNTWYNYSEGLWANAVTLNNTKRSFYQESPVGTKVDMTDINSMWVWIPRFRFVKMNDKFEIVFVQSNEQAMEAFNFNNQNVSGFWFAKFEAGLDENSKCIKERTTTSCNNSNQVIYFKPNLPTANRMTMANLFYAFRKMELKNNIYGFVNDGSKLNLDGTIKQDSNTFDIHMVKAWEWQAVAILTNSIYGKLGNDDYDNLNKTVYTNNTGYTGKSYYNKNSFDYDIKYFGTGASTTGNITGIYDMNGGMREYVMINNYNGELFVKKSNSGFTTRVKEYYYDSLANPDSLFTFSTKDEKEINTNPLTRGGSTISGDIFSMFGVSDYYNKISLQVNSRAVLVIGE